MRSSRGLYVVLGAMGATTLAVVGASCGGGTESASSGSSKSSGTHSTGSGSGGDGGGTGGHSTGDAGGGVGGNITQPDAGHPCSTAADCGGGDVCVDGICCSSVAAVCAGTCCAGGTVCLFDKCVTPGKDCHTANDCAAGQYCETGLGDAPADGGVPDGGNDAGPLGDGGAVCTAPLPLGGKCLDLPPVCADADAGIDAGCIAQCEYHPPVGQLNAVQKWQWGPTADTKPNYTDVWSTPVVGRIYDANCDGKVDELDPPNIVFVAGNDLAGAPAGTNCQSANIGGGAPSMCHTGVLRMLDGSTGKEIWTLDKPSANSVGFAGMSVAIGDIDGDGRIDIITASGEGYVVMVDSTGKVVRTSDKPLPGVTTATFGWGGGFAIADMDGDGFPEIAFGASVFSTKDGKITLLWTGAKGIGGSGVDEAMSTFVDLDGAADGHLELLAGNTAYKADGTILWNRNDLPDGLTAIGDFDRDGKPEVALVAGGKLWILNGADGTTQLGPVTIPGTGSGGPPTVADFDGDGVPEIGVAMATFYSMLKPDYVNKTIKVVWSTPNHDLSSSVTGSSVFDFEGDGKAEVIYADECYLWVFDGATGAVRYAAPTTSFTGTETSVVADVDGDGHAEIVLISNGADPSSKGWGCMDASGTPDTINGIKWTPSTFSNKSYRGVRVLGDVASSWVGTRTLWSEHTYHVSNICDDRDSACDAPNVYGSIPKVEKKNWGLPWLDNFRQNVQDKGLFDAPDATVSLTVDCSSPVVGHVQVRNIGLSGLPAGVDVGLFTRDGSTDTQVGSGTTTHALFPGQTESINITVTAGVSSKAAFVAKILIDPNAPKFHECRADNDESPVASASCVQ